MFTVSNVMGNMSSNATGDTADVFTDGLTDDTSDSAVDDVTQMMWLLLFPHEWMHVSLTIHILLVMSSLE